MAYQAVMAAARRNQTFFLQVNHCVLAGPVCQCKWTSALCDAMVERGDMFTGQEGKGTQEEVGVADPFSVWKEQRHSAAPCLSELLTHHKPTGVNFVLACHK